MTGEKQKDEQQDELRDLDVPVRDAETVSAGAVISPDNDLNLVARKRP